MISGNWGHLSARYGLAGYPLSHSFSPAFFGEKFRKEAISARYDAYPLEQAAAIPALIQSCGLRGLNVTIPHKEAVIPFLHHLDPHAAAIGAVNCIRVEADGTLRGFNTDWLGFGKSLSGWSPSLPKGALILGTGGAAKAVAYALTQLNIPFQNVSRKAGGGSLSYMDISGKLLDQYPLLINTTPLGTFPEIAEKPPLDYSLLTPENLLYDLVYNPAETAFMKEGLQRGCRVKNGLEMLHIQAEESWHIWTDTAREGF